MSHPLLTSIKPLLNKRGLPFPILSNLSGGTFSWLATLLANELDRPLVLVLKKPAQAEIIHRELLFFSAHLKRPLPLLGFPAWETLPFEKLSPFGPLVAERISTLFRLTQMSGQGPVLAGDESGLTQGIIVTTTSALMQRVMPREILTKHGFAIKKGDQLNLPAMRAFLAISGYRATSQVVESGEFAVRGGIVDFFPPGYEEPIRLELFGDEVETLRMFDPVTQRSTDPIPGVQALPTSEVILNEETIRSFRSQYRQTFGGNADELNFYKEISKGNKVQGMEHFLPLFYEPAETLFEYLPKESVFMLESGTFEAMDHFSKEIQERYSIVQYQAKQDHLMPIDGLYLDPKETQNRLSNFTVFDTLPGYQKQTFSLGFDPAPDFSGTSGSDSEEEKKSVLDRVCQHIKKAQTEGFRVCLSVRTMGQRERLRELLADHKLVTTNAAHWQAVFSAQPGSLFLTIGDVEQGFSHGRLGILLIPEESIFGRRTRRRQIDKRYIDQLLASFSDLNEGNLVVHADHGIGRFGGLHSLDVGTIRNEFLLISYLGDDKLYVPVENLDRVSKYSNSEEIILDKLGGNKWEKTKKKAKKKVLEMAAELVRLQALREAQRGFSFSGLDPLYQEFSASFPYEETQDQAQAIDSVLADMHAYKPMDRLVCGDVGFGKTEVAIRAAFRAIMDGKQVAVLTPTTILAQQHFDTFSSRLSPYPVTVALLSRFRTPKQIKQSLQHIAKGEADVVIGTHRLLQKDVVFKDLGLLVVDEEQRFGVSHKEKIKTMRAMVDILTLTATPIPRTMHLAMAGVRDISIIATPPVDRLSIRTIVAQYDKNQIREAILREIYRGGQVFYLYNRVTDIEKVAAQLSELVPEAKVGVAHGQMREGALEKIMFSFYQQEFNILVCTTIIENGVDIPSANTIIIHRADKFGLAQLHQLRGRVGRSKRRAYAYLLIPPTQNLSADAQKRLEAIETLGELGAGFSLATHDLEIRGAGNILGDEQSGQIREVGFELYNQMLKDAVLQLSKGYVPTPQQEEPEEILPVISLHLSTHIPSDYIPDVHQRLTLYKRIAELANPEEISDMRVELLDRFSTLPQSVDNLLRVVALKRLCRKLKILKLEAGPKGASITFHSEPNVLPSAIIGLIQKGGGSIQFNHQKGSLGIRDRNWEDADVRLKELDKVLQVLNPYHHSRSSPNPKSTIQQKPIAG